MNKPVCVIVGVGPGNGAAFAGKFAARGYRLALLARNEDYLTALAGTLPDARGYVCDATDAASINHAFSRINDELGPAAVLIYNASSRDFADIDHTSPEAFERAWRITTFGCLLAVQQVLPAMRALRHGAIVIIGATASLKGAAGFVAFAAAKAAQRSLAQSVARQVGPEGIHVAYVVVDGIIDLPSSRQAMPDQPQEFFMQPRDIAESVFFLTQQPRSAWTFELDLRPFGEQW